MPLGAFKAGLMGASGATAAADVVLLSSQTASNSASLSFTSDITSTYGEYIFKFYNINSATDEIQFHVNFSTDGGSNYNMTKTSTFFFGHVYESGSTPVLTYRTDGDLAQSTAFQPLVEYTGNQSDECCAGTMHLFNPASTTYVKHFYSRINNLHGSASSNDCFMSGYVNSTSDIDAVQFKMSSGNFDGTIKMWGVK